MTQSFSLNSDKRDIFIGHDGLLSINTGLFAVLQNCATAMQAQMGEMMFAMSEGMPTRQTAWDNYSPRLFEANARTVLLKVRDVTGIVSFAVSRTENNLNYIATIATIYGTGILKNG